MRKVLTGVAVLLVLAVVTQFYLAAVGAFDTAPKDESFSLHRSLGYLILLLAVLATLVAALARVPGSLVARAGLVAGLVLVQSLIRVLADALGDGGDATTTAGRFVFGLHAVNGLAIMAGAGALARGARNSAVEPSPSAERDLDTAGRAASEPPAAS